MENIWPEYESVWDLHCMIIDEHSAHIGCPPDTESNCAEDYWQQSSPTRPSLWPPPAPQRRSYEAPPDATQWSASGPSPRLLRGGPTSCAAAEPGSAYEASPGGRYIGGAPSEVKNKINWNERNYPHTWLRHPLSQPVVLHVDIAAQPGPSLKLPCDAPLPSPPGSPGYTCPPAQPCGHLAPPSADPPYPATAHGARWEVSAEPGGWPGRGIEGLPTGETECLCRSEFEWPPSCWWRAGVWTFPG